MVKSINFNAVKQMLQNIADKHGISVNDFDRSDIEKIDDIEKDVDSSKLYADIQVLEAEAEFMLNDFGFAFAGIVGDEQGRKCVLIEETIPIASSQELLKQLYSRIAVLMKYKMFHAYINRMLGWGGPLGHWGKEEGSTVYVRIIPYDDEGEVFTLGQLWNRDIGKMEVTLHIADETRTD